VLQSKHLDNYRTHIERGFSVFPPEQLNELRQQGRLELDDAGALMAPVVCSLKIVKNHRFGIICKFLSLI
jgi:hypothetical protein